MFSWNDTIHKMNKNNSLKNLLNKLKDKNAVVVIYTPIATIGLNQLLNDNALSKFVDNNEISMLHIQTPKGSRDVYLEDYDTYRFNNSKNMLTILFYNKDEVEIYF